ncbi:MAG: hypothetical protein NXI31_03890 [bacterium]|nr:hypothetical protein [bacterium]
MSKAARLWLLLPALVAGGWYLAVLLHGFRSDDFLTVYYYDRDAGAVKWGRVFEEWVRPWFGVRDLYRPVVSLSFGCNWLLSTAPFGFHLFNLLLLCCTATLVALAALRLAPAGAGARWSTTAAVVAGLVVVLHPAAVEPTAWVAARTTGLQVCFSALAYWSFLRWRDGDGRVWLPLLATALACASKEGAVLLPFSLVVLDLLRARQRLGWRVHLPFFALVGGYLLWRRVLLGVFTTAESGHTIGERLQNAAALAEQLVFASSGQYAIAAGLLLVLVAVPLRGVLCAPWIGLLLLPGTTHVVLSENLLAGRFLFDAVPALGLGCAVTVASTVRWRAVVGLAGSGLALVGLVIGSGDEIATYDRENLIVRQAQEALVRDAGAAAASGRPFGVTGLPGLPLLQPELVGFLTQRPFVARDLHVVPLGNVLTPNEHSGAFGDATSVHAMVQFGAGAATWDADARRLQAVARVGSTSFELVRDPADARRFVPPRLVSPMAVAALEIVVPAEVDRWRGAILGNLPGDYEAAGFAAVRPTDLGMASTWVSWVDASRFLPWLVAGTLGGVPAGVELSNAGKPLPAGVVVRAHGPLMIRDGDAAAGHAVSVDRAELAAVLERDFDAVGGLAGTVFVAMPTGVFAARRASGPTGFELPASLRTQLTYVADVLGPTRVHWCWRFDADPGERPRASRWRSIVVR